jgi:hypothetical protein
MKSPETAHENVMRLTLYAIPGTLGVQSIDGT